MYKSIKINNFRGFKEFEMDNLGRVNLIAGVNNVGKTALLEAIFLHCGAYNPALTLKIDSFRGFGQIHVEFDRSRLEKSPWDSLFHDFDKSRKIEINGKFTDGSVRNIGLQIVRPSGESPEKGPIIQYGPSALKNPPLDTENTIVLKLNYEEFTKKKSKMNHGSSFLSIGPGGVGTPIIKQPPFPAAFLPARYRPPPEEDAKWFSDLEVVGQHDMLLVSLKLIEPKLKRVAVVATGGAPVLFGDIGLKQMLPLAYMGDGMSRFASLILAISHSKGGVVLIDEIENGFHHTMMKKVWDAIGKVASSSDTQIFATTHSLECIIAAHKAFTLAENYDLLVHRLNREVDAIKDVTFSKCDLDTAFEMKMDVR